MGRLRLYFYAGKIAHFSFTYEKLNKTDGLQQYGCIGPLVYIFCVHLSVFAGCNVLDLGIRQHKTFKSLFHSFLV